MATSTRIPPALAETFQFRPRWWWDPVPDWVMDHLSAAVIRELAVINMQSQMAVLDVQRKALEQSMAALRKTK